MSFMNIDAKILKKVWQMSTPQDTSKTAHRDRVGFVLGVQT